MDEMTMQTQTARQPLRGAEAIVARLFWEGKLPGRKQAEAALVVLETLEAQQRALTMDQILEAAGSRGEILRVRPGLVSASKISETARVAVRILLAEGALTRSGYSYRLPTSGS